MTPHDHRQFVAGCFRCELGRDEAIDALDDRYVASGAIDPACDYCRSNLIPGLLETGSVPFAPRHRPSAMCRSGARPHCTCDACF